MKKVLIASALVAMLLVGIGFVKVVNRVQGADKLKAAIEAEEVALEKARKGDDNEYVLVKSVTGGTFSKWEQDNMRPWVLDTMHHMANTKIVADAIRGEVPITPEKVEEVLEMVNKYEYTDKAKLLSILKNWKNGDFSNCVEEHNYLWEQLGGTIGKAARLRIGVE